jgi:hypothetical protein
MMIDKEVTIVEAQPMCLVEIEPKSWAHVHGAAINPPREIAIAIGPIMEQRISNGKWLQSKELTLCMYFLRKQFPNLGGLIDPGYFVGPRLPEQASQCNNIYIVYCGGNHWACTQYTCKAHVVKLFDSMVRKKIQKM